MKRTGQECQFCDQPAADETAAIGLALCEKHLDLAVLCEYIADEKRPVTVKTVTALLARCRANNGSLAIDEADVAWLLTGEFASRYAGKGE
jgi:hypothetical protein